VRRSGRLAQAVFWLGILAAAGMLVVLVMGARVTTTGSAQGCGRDWPLCNGRLIPDFTLAAAIEFSHRAVTGVEGVLIVGLTIAVLALYRRERPVRILAPLMLGSLLLQAGMGAWAVKYPQQPVVLALHFGISLVALATTTLTALYVRPDATPGGPAASRGAAENPAGPLAPMHPISGVDASGARSRVDERAALRSSASPPDLGHLDTKSLGRVSGRASGRLRLATWPARPTCTRSCTPARTFRHVGAAAACTSWPLCGGGAPLGAGAVAVDVLHRLAAGAALLVAVALLVAYRRAAPGRADLSTGAWILVAALVAQAGAGAILVLSGFGLSAELLHSALTAITFTAAAYLCMLVTLRAAGDTAAVAAEPAPSPAPRLRSEGVP